ncbi:MAG TPA: SRPBCC domain-containing protein, partial [Opitutaceae bacterium]|nr:SRPBCC domain-containing protein [Opitutaceae bacterium]
MIAKWKVPDGMKCQVHSFEPRAGGVLRISLTYDQPTGSGKSSAQTDTYHGRFVELVPDRKVVEVDEFETRDPALRGEMKITITLKDSGGGTDFLAVHENLHKAGWQMALAKLAKLVEADSADAGP